MYKSLVCFILLFCSLSTIAQDDKSPNINSYDRKDEFPLKQFELADRIHRFTIHDSLITFQLRDKRGNGDLKARGKVVQFDLNNEKKLWDFKISYVYEHIISLKDYFYYYTQTDSYQLDPISGKKVARLNTNYIYLDTINQIGLGYPVKIYPDNTNRLEAVDLKTNEKLWVRDVKRNGQWSNVEKINDRSILVLANGLEKIDVLNGEGWKIASEDNEAVISNTAAIIGGFVLGGIFGGIIVSVALPTDIKSIPNRPKNLITEGDSIAYASITGQLVKSDLKGDKIWSTEVMKNDIQLAELIKKNDRLFLVYSGQFFDGKRYVSRKRPQLAVINEKNGHILFEEDLKPRSYYALEDYGFIGDSLLLIYSNELAYFDFQNNTVSREKKLEGAKFNLMLTETTYLLKDSTLQVLSKSKHFYLSTQNDKVHEVDRDLNIRNHFDKDHIYTEFLSYKELSLILNLSDNRALLIDKNQNILLKLPSITQAEFKNNQLFYSHDNQFNVLDLNQYFKK